MFDVVLGIAMIIAVIWWFGRDTSPSGPPAPKSPPPRSTSGGAAPRMGPADRLPEATRGDDAFIDGLIIGAYWYGHPGRGGFDDPFDFDDGDF